MCCSARKLEKRQRKQALKDAIAALVEQHKNGQKVSLPAQPQPETQYTHRALPIITPSAPPAYDSVKVQGNQSALDELRAMEKRHELERRELMERILGGGKGAY